MTNQDSKTTSNSKINGSKDKLFNNEIDKKSYFTEINNLLNEIKRNDEYHLVKYDQDLFKRYYGDDFSDLDEIEQNAALIDYFWEKLTNGGAEVQCGWLNDKFGVPWQIVPKQMTEMMSTGTPEQIKRVTDAFMQMKKFDIATLEQVFKG